MCFSVFREFANQLRLKGRNRSLERLVLFCAVILDMQILWMASARQYLKQRMQ